MNMSSSSGESNSADVGGAIHGTMMARATTTTSQVLQSYTPPDYGDNSGYHSGMDNEDEEEQRMESRIDEDNESVEDNVSGSYDHRRQGVIQNR